MERSEYPAPSCPLNAPGSISPDRCLRTWGCAAVLGPQWYQWQWPPEWSSVSIMAKELIPIIFTCVAWGTHLSKHHINFQCDNASLVAAINKGSSKDQFVMHLLRCLWFLVAYFDIYITATHLPVAINVTADHLSRGKLLQAFQSTPSLSQQPTSLLHYFIIPAYLSSGPGLDIHTISSVVLSNH